MEKVKREKLIMKIVCTSLAIILWFYVSFFENPTMTKTVDNVPVSITDEQVDRLKGKGLSIYSISKGGVDVKVTAPRLTLATQTNKTLSAYVNISSINKSGIYYLPVNIVSDDGANASYYVEGKDIKVVVEPILTGSFKVEANIDSNYVAYEGCELSTNTVKVSAPKSVFDQIDSVKTEYVTINDRIDAKEKGLILYDQEGKILDKENVDFIPSKIDMKFSYLDEKTVPVILTTASGKEITLPEEYKVTIYGDAEILNSVTSVKTEIFDLKHNDENAPIKIQLDLPLGVKVSENNKQLEIKLTSDFLNNI